MSELYAIDIETTGLDRFTDRILCVGIYSPTFTKCFATVSEFIEWHNNQINPGYIAHRGSFDFNFLRHNGIDLSGSWHFDTRSGASILVPRPRLAVGQKHELGLENLAIELLNQAPYKLDRTDMTSYSWEELSSYCLKDCELTYRLYDYMMRKLPPKSVEFIESWLMPATKFCADLEWNGVPIDEKGLAVYQVEIQAQRDVVHAELQAMCVQAVKFYHELQITEVTNKYREMYETAKEKAKDKEKCKARYSALRDVAIGKIEQFNWNSSEQLKWLLRDYYQLDLYSDREDKETTGEAMLKTLDHPVAKKLCEYRELEKLCSTCIPALVDNATAGVVHASYNVGGTRTGRLSSSGPNLQQIPRGKIRSFLKAEDKKVLVTIDYAQIEVRIIAELAKEKELIDAFQKEIDPYSIIAKKLLKIDCPVEEVKTRFKKERDVSKTAGLSILYGTGAAKLQEVLSKELGRNYTVAECRQFISEYRESLPGTKALRSRLDRSLANGKIAYNLLERPFNIPSNDDIYMKGLNTLVQGSASDLVIWSQTNFVIPALKALGVDFTHRMVIHDEVVIELREDEAELLTNDVIVPAMTTQIEKALGLSVPLKVEFGISQVWEKP